MYADLPTIIFAIAAIISAIIALLIPETKDAELFEHVAEVEKVGARIRAESQHADSIGKTLRAFTGNLKPPGSPKTSNINEGQA